MFCMSALFGSTYWYFLEINFWFQPKVRDECHNLMQKAIGFNDISIASVKGNDYGILFWYMIKDKAINSLRNTKLMEKSGTL